MAAVQLLLFYVQPGLELAHIRLLELCHVSQLQQGGQVDDLPDVLL